MIIPDKQKGRFHHFFHQFSVYTFAENNLNQVSIKKNNHENDKYQISLGILFFLYP